MDSRASFAIKAEVRDLHANTFVFVAQKTMYGGKEVKVGDYVALFASENEGGSGLIARGIVTSKVDVPRTAAARQTPRVSMTLYRMDTAKRPLGRTQLRGFRNWSDGAPETELNFKLYRQATNKVVGLSAMADEFLKSFF